MKKTITAVFAFLLAILMVTALSFGAFAEETKIDILASRAAELQKLSVSGIGEHKELCIESLRSRAAEEMVISEKMKGQLRGLDQTSFNAKDGISVVQAAEGALNDTIEILRSMREHAVKEAELENEASKNDHLNEIDKELERLDEQNGQQVNEEEFFVIEEPQTRKVPIAETEQTIPDLQNRSDEVRSAAMEQALRELQGE